MRSLLTVLFVLFCGQPAAASAEVQSVDPGMRDALGRHYRTVDLDLYMQPVRLSFMTAFSGSFERLTMAEIDKGGSDPLSGEARERVLSLLPGLKADFNEMLNQCLDKVWTVENLKSVYTRAILQRLTPAELDEVTRFYQSALGQKLLRVQGQLIAEIVARIKNVDGDDLADMLSPKDQLEILQRLLTNAEISEVVRFRSSTVGGKYERVRGAVDDQFGADFDRQCEADMKRFEEIVELKIKLLQP